MKRLIRDLILTFYSGPGGFSARKLSAFLAVVMAVYTTARQTTETNLGEVLAVWLIFALVCLGIVTAEQLIKLKRGKQ